MAIEAQPETPSVHRILIQDAGGDQYGVVIYVWELAESPIPDRDVRQVDYETAKLFCRDNYGVGSADWQEVPDEDMTAAEGMPVWYKTYRKKNPWTWFT